MSNFLGSLQMGYRGAKVAEIKERYIAEFNRMEQFIKTQALDVKLDSCMIQDSIERAMRRIEAERMDMKAKVTE
ncbi:hypothetical protein [Baia soyae]|uniref:Uncharacterized protein n=1 Tax=Baia soyae TaxID=1544746 RepID=A0A4R2REM3_9BACL|nr:hypothetical protein [Baia soyae]TCP61283.1 hypothetical protein EDD57_1635 [Baia soyae]